MRDRDIYSLFQKSPVICAVKNLKDTEKAASSHAAALFFLSGDIFSLEKAVNLARQAGKLTFAHAEMVEGIKQDRAGIRFLKERLGLDGVISTKNSMISYAREVSLLAVQRLFILDSAALKTGAEIIKKTRPYAVEVLPGMSAPYFSPAAEEAGIPLIAGGLVKTPEEAGLLLQEKAVVAVSTSSKELWNYR